MILVTGAAGFIGSNLVKKLNQSGVKDIYVCDQLKYDHDGFKNLIDLDFYDYIEVSKLYQITKLDPYFYKKFTHVFHLGANSSTTEKNNAQLIENNYEFSKMLCEACLEFDCRFIYASSAATYGDGKNGMSDKEEDLSVFRPLNMYGYSKHLFDLYLQKTDKLNSVTGLKYFNIFGPREQYKGNMRSLISKAVDEIRETNQLNLFKSNTLEYKDGDQKRDFLYVQDAVDMTLHLANTRSFGIFNVGSGQANSWNYLARCIFDALDLPFQVNYIPIPENISKNYQNYTKANISKLVMTGYDKKITPLNEAVSDYIKNYLR